MNFYTKHINDLNKIDFLQLNCAGNSNETVVNDDTIEIKEDFEKMPKSTKFDEKTFLKLQKNRKSRKEKIYLYYYNML